MSKLSPKSFAVLSLVADGHSYDQIVESHPELTYLDVFRAAREVLELNESGSDHSERLATIKAEYPRAYQTWDSGEDSQLRDLHSKGRAISDLASHFQRQPSAIRTDSEKEG